MLWHLPNGDQRNIFPQLCGHSRVLPDNVDYHSRSWLAKLGYHLTPQHFIQGFFENLEQSRKILEKVFMLQIVKKRAI